MTFPRISVNKSSKLTKQLLSTSLSELLHNIFLTLCEETERLRKEMFSIQVIFRNYETFIKMNKTMKEEHWKIFAIK